MAVSELAGKPAPADMLIDVETLIKTYYERKPDVSVVAEQVSFGTSGHRGSSLDGTFTQAHILAITQAIVDYRAKEGISGPVFMGKDTHALSTPAQETALEVLAANGVQTIIAATGSTPGSGFTPTPVISHAILKFNEERENGLADGIVITPSHNPPQDGGFKYNNTQGGPADTGATAWIQDRANDLLRAHLQGIKRTDYKAALGASTTAQHDYVTPYVDDLPNVINLDIIQNAKLKLGADPLGGASLAYWIAIAETYRLNLQIVNRTVDPRFAFMSVDHDGKIRMDCSSPYAMAGLVKLKDSYAVAWGNDPDSDRHGIVTPSAGLLNPNHYLAVAIQYLIENRPDWPSAAGIGKTVVSSSMIDRVVQRAAKKLVEVPVGFKWFAPGLFDGSLLFGGEESAGASFLRLDGSVWSTDKDGIILALLAAEITARTGKDPGIHYAKLTGEFGTPFYNRMDAPATVEQKAAFKKLTPEKVTATTLAGEAITAKLTNAPGNGAAIGGLKVTTENGWFAARPSGTENLYKIYAESFRDPGHLDEIMREAQELVGAALK
jgi:phosphoglucomutase